MWGRDNMTERKRTNKKKHCNCKVVAGLRNVEGWEKFTDVEMMEYFTPSEMTMFMLCEVKNGYQCANVGCINHQRE